MKIAIPGNYCLLQIKIENFSLKLFGIGFSPGDRNQNSKLTIGEFNLKHTVNEFLSGPDSKT